MSASLIVRVEEYPDTIAALLDAVPRTHIAEIVVVGAVESVKESETAAAAIRRIQRDGVRLSMVPCEFPHVPSICVHTAVQSLTRVSGLVLIWKTGFIGYHPDHFSCMSQLLETSYECAVGVTDNVRLPASSNTPLRGYVRHYLEEFFTLQERELILISNRLEYHLDMWFRRNASAEMVQRLSGIAVGGRSWKSGPIYLRGLRPVVEPAPAFNWATWVKGLLSPQF